MNKIKIKRKYSLIPAYEFWPFWILYSAFFPLYLIYSFRLRTLTYCTLCNPSIRNGGLLNYSKKKILDFLPPSSLPKTLLWQNENDDLLDFPFIAKPDMGERGKGVEIVHNQRDWCNYISHCSPPIQLQSFIDWPLEFGVFYYRFPNRQKGNILGITGKEFLTLKGDGKTKIKDFILQNKRAFLRKSYLFEKFKTQLHYVIPKGEELILEEIGNHNRGTRFYDASELMTSELVSKLDQLLKDIPDFYYGRLDLKAESLKSFQKGQFVILEVNGTNSEATHIYDSQYCLWDAYRIIYKKLQIQFQIAKINKKLGHLPTPTLLLAKEIIQRLCSHKN